MNQQSDQDNRVVVAIDKDKGSQYALKWAADHVLHRGQNVTLIHVKNKPSTVPSPNGNMVAISDVNQDVARAVKQQVDSQAREVFIPFRCFCTRKDIKCQEIILEDSDISKAIIDYTKSNMFDTLVLGASTRSGLVRKFKGPDVPTMVSKGAPDFTTVYIICKAKIMSVKSATCMVPTNLSLLPQQILRSPSQSMASSFSDNYTYGTSSQGDWSKHSLQKPREDNDQIKSPFTRGKALNGRSYGEISMPECDISFVGSNKPTQDRMFSYDNIDFGQCPRLSVGSETADRLSLGSYSSDVRLSMEINYNTGCSSQSSSNCSGFSSSSLNLEDVESEMRRLRQELKQTMDMYNAACKEALIAKQTAKDLQVSKAEEHEKLEEALMAEEAALAIVNKEKQKCRAAMEAAEASQKIAELEGQKRINAEMKALRESEEKKAALDALSHHDVKCRIYSIEEIEAATENLTDSLKIGEGGYGPVYRCTLDHTPVAIKVLRSDAAQGQSQFNQEVDILSRIRHPNMVILLGACPDHGCLVYEYMCNGSLEDRLFRKGNTPPLPWQVRFRIAAEIGTALLFLHQTKPDPLVHRDLKPGNILLDRNLVSKISDVGLARLVPPSVTQYQMTQAVGTFCYIDPEYQQTGMLGIKSDIYSLGILFLQIITARSPMGLTRHVDRAIQKGNFMDVLDPTIKDWPIEETLLFANLSLKCAELRRKDRPDLAKVILPELNRLRAIAEDHRPMRE